ncbi:MAG: hypothetical protein LBD07_01560 [Spirochaetaceae bacterium]|jgi:hypothetical protein|nr:hypothetical protein [Spirochaetaceae bacterium]
MKKILFIGCFAVVVFQAAAFQESYLTIGASYKHLFTITDKRQLSDRDKGMAGGYITAYGFWNEKNIGLFAHGNWIVPVSMQKIEGDSNLDTYGGLIQEAIIGVGFRHSFSGRLILLWGIGADLNLDMINYGFKDTKDTYSASLVNLGIGGEAQLKFDINNVFYVAAGFSPSYTFISYTNVEKSYNGAASGWDVKSIVGISPFIGFGFNRYDYKYWGKSKEIRQ